jgi:NAD(P)-dependent dehydrogenase (short-subunit alcohol dehydrogenase family)
MTSKSRHSMFDLNGQTALITGGGTGLGFGMAKCFVACGAKVILVGRRPEELEKAATALGANAFTLPGDVGKLETIPALVKEAEKLAGPISILVNNAGVHLKKSSLETSDAEFAAVLQTHVFGACLFFRAVRPGILFTASMASLLGIPLVVAYAAAKSAYTGMVRTLAVELGSQGVRVNAVAPGWIESEMMNKALSDDPARSAKILERTPMNKFGAPEDIGWAAVYLCSPAAQFVTGVVLPVDGGAAIGF